MATQSDFVAAPRKRLAAYGKAAKRQPAPAAPTTSGFTPFAGDIWDPVDDAPAPAPSTTKATATKAAAAARSTAPLRSPPPHPPKTQAVRRVAEPKNKQPNRQYGRRGTSKLPELPHSQPLPTSTATDLQSDEESQRTKKRKLTRTISARERSAGLYSTPDSSPTGVRSPKSPPENKRAPLGVKSPPSSQSTPRKDVVMRDSDPAQVSLPFSAKTSRALDTLSISGKPAERNQIPLRIGRTNPGRPVSALPAVSQPSTSQAVPAAKKREQPTVHTSKPQRVPEPAPRKKRLIDVLAEQAEESSSSEDEVWVEDELASLRNRVAAGTRSTPPPVIQPQPQSALRVRAQPMGKKPGPKFTYGQQRTILAEPDPLLGNLGLGSSVDGASKAPLFDFASLANTSTANAFSFMDEDDETANTGAVRTIHELRQAGANSRFGDEMDDIMDRISAPTAKPSSLRRGALLELAQKVQEKDFRRQFRNHGEGGLFKQVGQEMDIIGGFAIVSALVTLFASSTSAHLVPQLRDQGITTFLTRFLGETSDITAIAKDRKSNVSKNGQNTLVAVKAAVLKLPIWEPTVPKALTPRTLALKCLDLILRHSTDPAMEDDIFTPTVTDLLFSVLSTSVSDETYWGFPSQQESTDLYYTLSLLESHSVNVMQSQLGFKWTSQYVPIVADVLETALRRPADKFDQLESLTLRLTLNATNNNPDAAGIFVNNGLLGALAATACSTFEVLQKSMKDGKFLPQTLESLIILLGVMINFCEHYPPAAQSLNDAEDGSPLNRLIRAFLNHYSTTSDADSMEKTQFNVAFAYLSILLGCLCLHDSIRVTFLENCPQKTLHPLINSIKEFVMLQKMAARAMEGEGESRPENGATERLERMIRQLERL